ncbi:MAG: ribosome small subunit-dependent GTPase A [Spirochaetales bacterium]|nr:ribosome small subunit-dependent GTPase A [Spirochaetales bacterium]
MNSKWGSYPDDKIPNGSESAARVISRNREAYLIADGDNVYKARTTGKMAYRAIENAELPVVGDWVLYRLHDDLAVMNTILPRFSVISRKVAGLTTEEQPIAANINTVAIIFGLDGGRNFNVRALERYLAIAWNSGARPLVILNKADLCDDPEAIRSETEYNAPSVEVIITSATTGEGLDLIRSRVPAGDTIVFIGPSGVGKSALTNALLEKDVQQTGVTRTKDKRGRHTTTASTLITVPGAGVCIDSPGLKEIQLWGESEHLDQIFGEISGLAEECRFSDCRHQGEPGCAVQKALAEGSLLPERYESYLELRRELDYLETKQNERAKHEYRARDKRLAMMIRDMKNKKIIY